MFTGTSDFEMNILVITDVLWRTDNGVGNSYSNIFANLPNVKIQNICCQEGRSDNTVSTRCLRTLNTGPSYTISLFIVFSSNIMVYLYNNLIIY